MENMNWQELKAYFEGMKSINHQLDIRMLRDEYDEEGIKFYLYDVVVEHQSLILISQDILKLPEMGPMAKSLFIDSAMLINIIKREDIVNEIHQALMADLDSPTWVSADQYNEIVQGTVKERIDQAIERLNIL